jgi:predicted transcriptional regulator
MRQKKPPELTPAELRLMNIIWQKGRATVAEVAAALPRDLPLAYNTVLTTMRIMEGKGHLRHAKAKDGRAFVYIPKVGRMEAKRNAIRHLLGRFFGGSPESLVLNLLEDDTLGGAELRKIRQLLQERKGEAE